MLVYPHGCREVENIVLFLAAQLNSFGIEVLVDNLQTERVAKYGLPFVLMKDFKDSNYVITLCTESESKFEFKTQILKINVLKGSRFHSAHCLL